MPKEKNSKTTIQKTARILIKIVLFLLLFIVVLFILLLTPPVQRFATTKVENYLEKKLKTKVEIGNISIGLPRKFILNDIFLEDQTKDTLVSGGTIKADISLLKLLSSEVEIENLEFKDITAKVKRILPDTAFNFQFIMDAFLTEQPKKTDTSQTTPLKLEVNNLEISNLRVLYKDILTGNDMSLHLGSLNAKIDTLDIDQSHFSIPLLDIKNVTARLNQSQPLAVAESALQDISEAAVPLQMKIDLGIVNLDSFNVDYSNDVSAFYTHFNIGHLQLDGNNLDFENRIIRFDEFQLQNAVSVIRLGKKQMARVLEKEIVKEVKLKQQQNWSFRVDNIVIDNNFLQFDNDNTPATNYGLDYAHMRADSLSLHIKNFVMDSDSMGGLITKGEFKEKSGFQLDALRANLLYSNNQSFIKDLYLKTPGTELKRNLVLEYESFDALIKKFPQTIMDIDIENSHIQVKDILSFVPQLRNHPAFSDPGDIWQLNIQGSGNLNRLHFDHLQFNGLKNTQIDAEGILAGLTDPNTTGGTFTIHRLHTSQTDLSLFTGARLSNAQMNLPETFALQGTLAGNVSNLKTALVLNTSMGNIAIKGTFNNLMNPVAARYNTNIRASALQIGNILRNTVPIGSISATINMTGTGFTPANINTNFNGTVHSVDYNKYAYRNIKLDGSLKENNFVINTDISDPNIDLTISASGNISDDLSFKINTVVDSIKTLPLHFTTTPFVFQGKIDADISSVKPEFLNADILITDALFVTGDKRLALDSIVASAGRNDTAAQFITLRSDIANATISGLYRYSELGSIIQNNIQPYFSLSSSAKQNVHPYDFNFSADIVNSPLLSAFVPGLEIKENIHTEGRVSTEEGLNASLSSPFIIYQKSEISNLNFKATTTPNGLELMGNLGHLKTSSTIEIYNVALNARALNNNIDFNLNVQDKNAKDKYHLGGLLTQPKTGTFALHLNPDSLLLNYEAWTVSPNNHLEVSPESITATDFILSKDVQHLGLASIDGDGFPLNVSFKSFRLGTITGFLKSDSLLVDGTMNGILTLKSLLQQPVFTSDLTITDLSLKQDTIGNINLQVSSDANSRYNTNVTITGKGNDVALTGYFQPEGKNIVLDLDLAIRQLYLNSVEGALAEFVKSASGSINGEVKIKGTTSDPRVQGEINFDKASVTTRITGGPLRIDNEKISVTENGFVFDKFSITDTTGQPLTIDGTVKTTNFINYTFDLDVDATDFMALNTTKQDNKIFYGKLNVSTSLHIEGNELQPSVDGSITINKGTDFTIVIPQAEPGVVEREGVVQFVDFDSPQNDSLFLAYDSLNASSITGFDFTANIDINKEANFNVVVDAANGDLLNLRGEGQLTTGIDPSGKITLTGTYEIEEGGYQFSFNFLRRKFEIEKGSKITWLGEPTNAELDVTAKYIANTAPLDLVQNQIQDETQKNYYLQKLPFQVLLNLEGQLLKPQLTFNILLPEDQNYNVSGDIVSTVNTRLEQLRQEPSELNKQVFSILLLNRFVGENPFQSSGSGFSAESFARTSVSKLLTEQLNDLAGGLIGGVDINFDVASSDDYTTGARRTRTDLNVGLSKRLLNDRLTVTVGSNIGLEGPQQSSQGSNIAGDISVNYQLSKDGRYMLRFYRKNEYEGLVDGYVIETGLGFILTVDYNRFREIFQSREKRKEQRERRKAQKENVQQ